MVTGSSIRRLDIGYLDLYLEHQALNDYFAAWRAMGGGRYNPFDDEDFKAIAGAHGKTVGQVLLRWNVQRGVVVIPKSTHVERIAENYDIWDFELDDNEMACISAHDMGYSGSRAKHFEPSFVRMVLGKE